VTRLREPISVGEIIRAARLRAGLTQRELAILAGTKYRSSITHIEGGRWHPSAKLVGRLLAECEAARRLAAGDRGQGTAGR
jgi:transcriptional regulator with XRE-family HTH domain